MKRIRFAAIAALISSSIANAQIVQLPSIKPLSSSALSSEWIVSAKPITVSRIAVTTSNVAGYLMVFDSSATVPDGPVKPVFCRPIGVGSNVPIVFTIPARFDSGLVLSFSSTGCYNKTASATAFFEASPR